MSVFDTHYVHIIESPSPDDFRLGNLESRALTPVLELLGIQHHSQFAVTPEAFEAALTTDIPAVSTSLGKFPILHFALHGCESGVGVTSEHQTGQSIKWAELAALIRAARNQITENFSLESPLVLILCMSCCGGSHGGKMANVLSEEEVPFSFLIGTPNATDIRDLTLAFSAFYRGLQRGDDEGKLLNAMKLIGNDGGFQLVTGQSQQLQHKRVMVETAKQVLLQHAPEVLSPTTTKPAENNAT